MNIKIIVGSTREGRFSSTAAKWIWETVAKNKGVSVEVLDLKEYEMPFFDQAITPSFKKEPYNNEVVEKFTAKIAEADAFIMVTPEYNHGTSAVLKNALDWVSKEWNNKPVSFVSYGSVGGARAVEQLRLSVIELQMAPTREAIHINGEQYFPVIMGGGDTTELLAKYTEKAESMIAQLLWWSNALKKARSNQ